VGRTSTMPSNNRLWNTILPAFCSGLNLYAAMWFAVTPEIEHKLWGRLGLALMKPGEGYFPALPGGPTFILACGSMGGELNGATSQCLWRGACCTHRMPPSPACSSGGGSDKSFVMPPARALQTVQESADPRPNVSILTSLISGLLWGVTTLSCQH